MKKYQICMEATASATVVVEADNPREAYEIARDEYRAPESIKKRDVYVTGQWSPEEYAVPVEVGE